MCGRYATSRSAADLSALFEAVDETGGVGPRYNVAPTDSVPLVRVCRRQGARVLSTGRWGLLPHWAKEPRQGARMINARLESVAASPAYASAYAARRALVPADGWYEWQARPGGGKQPYFITPRDGSVLALAGVWSRWGKERLLTFSVLTTAAVGELAEVHDRMPLVLPPEQWRQWLGDGQPPTRVGPPAELVARWELRPVGQAVGNVRNDRPELVTRVDPASAAEPLSPGLF